jgi:membrane fusion protein (multidrug efflux system)
LAVARALDQAKAEMVMAKFHLSATKLHFLVPLIEFKKLGSLIDEELLTSLSDNSEMFAYFNVSSARIFRL